MARVERFAITGSSGSRGGGGFDGKPLLIQIIAMLGNPGLRIGCDHGDAAILILGQLTRFGTAGEEYAAWLALDRNKLAH